MHRWLRLWSLGIAVLIASWVLCLSAAPVQAQAVCADDFCIYLPLVARDYDSTWIWGEVVSPSLTPAPAYVANPLMSVDRQGRAHIFWEATASGTPRFIYHTYLAATGWTTPTAVAQSLGTSSLLYPPVVAPDGAMHLLWLNRETTQEPYRTLYAAFRNDAWGAEEEVYRAPINYSLQGMVHLDESGQVHATMVQSFLFNDVYHVTRGSVGWSQPVMLARPQYNRLVWPDQQGGVRFYGNDYESPPNLYYSYWRNGQFITRDQRGPDRLTLSSSQRTQLDGQNNLHLFWSAPVALPGGQVTGLYHQCVNSALQVTGAVVLTGGHTAYISDAARVAGFVRWTALAWREDSGARVQLALWNGCNRTDLKTVPFPGTGWTVRAVAVRDAPGKICVLGYLSTSPARYNIVCADVLR